MEFTITGANALTYPHLHIWDWRVAIYLFLGGLAGGCMSMAAVANLRPGKDVPKNQACCWRVPMMTPIILAVGMGFLFLDLQVKQHMYRFYMTLQPLSPMSWGSWILVLVFPAMIAFALSTVPESAMDKLKDGMIRNLIIKAQNSMRPLAKLNFLLGILLSIYTGILLSSFMARPLWNSSILPVLFLNSGMSTGAATMILMARRSSIKLFFTKVDIWLIFSEITVLILLYYGQFTSPEASRESIMPFFTLTSQYFPYFISILTLSIVLPLAIILKFLELSGDHSENLELTFKQKFEMNASAVLVLLGGAIIRFALVYAGQLSKFTGLS
ncbi:MAG: polysulfide reductase NrfD [Deltaproteobacteria bacterium]|nr:polysulfide reductase NrfD [Deltaproteobacteria bacterium]